MTNKEKDLQINKEFEEEFSWLFDGEILYTGAFGQITGLNVEMTKEDIKHFYNTRIKRMLEELIIKIKQIPSDTAQLNGTDFLNKDKVIRLIENIIIK